MKRLKLTKVIASTLAVVSILALNQIGASAEWKHDTYGWWYAKGNSYYKNTIASIDENIYRFDSNGYMKTGWDEYFGNWYYYYNDGHMAQNTAVDGYVFNVIGRWIPNITWNDVEYYKNIVIKNVDIAKFKGQSKYFSTFLQGNQIQFLGIAKDCTGSNISNFSIKDGVEFNIFESDSQPITCVVDRTTNKIYTLRNEDSYWECLTEWSNKQKVKENLENVYKK